MTMRRKLYVTTLLLQCTVLCFGLPPYKADFEQNEDSVISADPSSSKYDEAMLKASDLDPLYFDLDNCDLEPLQRQFKQSTSPDLLEKKAMLPTSDDSDGMEDLLTSKIRNGRKERNLKINDDVSNHIIDYQGVIIIVFLWLLLSIAAAIYCCSFYWCGCGCRHRSCRTRRHMNTAKNDVASNPSQV
jgi:hypothetical protein